MTKATDKEAAAAVQAACGCLPPGCEVLMIVAAPEDHPTASHRLDAYSNMNPALACRIYELAAPLFRSGASTKVIAMPGYDS